MRDCLGRDLQPSLLSVYTVSSMGKKTNKQNSLRALFDQVVHRAKRNEHVGAARSADLEKELDRIAKRVHQTLVIINKEAEKDPSPEQVTKVTAKLEQTTELLTSELMRLSAMYHRQIDTARIRRFLSEQQEIVRTSMDDGEESSVTLDENVAQLHSMMADERRRVSRNEQKERAKFVISLSIALASLSLSIYALWLR